MLLWEFIHAYKEKEEENFIIQLVILLMQEKLLEMK